MTDLEIGLETDSKEIARKILEEFEGCRLKAYQPVKGDKWTIGFGHTAGVRKGDEISYEKALDYLDQDIAYVEEAVQNMVKIHLSNYQRAAIISLVFNVGAESFYKSKALMALNLGAFDVFIYEAFSKEAGWVRFKGQPLQGLINRRSKEQDLFEGRLRYI